MKYRNLLIAMIIAMVTVPAKAGHWTVAPENDQYFMDGFYSLTIDGEAITDASRYELAVMCGDECRGVARLIDQDGYLLWALRAYSNSPEGQALQYRVYDTEQGRELKLCEFSTEFADQTFVGWIDAMQSLAFTGVIPGDANGDNIITVSDIVTVIDCILTGNTDLIILDAADVNGDGIITVTDVVWIVDMILKAQD